MVFTETNFSQILLCVCSATLPSLLKPIGIPSCRCVIQLCNAIRHGGYSLATTQMTALLYLSQHLTDDCGNEKSGVVIVFFPTSNFDISSIAEPEARRDLRSVISSAGLSPSAIHICLPNTAFHRLTGAFFKVVFPSHLAIRIRIHTGTCQFTLCMINIMWFVCRGVIEAL